MLPRLAAVQEPGRYALNEFRRVPLAARYRLRRTGSTVYVRHHSTDGDRLAEVFVFRRYRPPAEAARILAALGPAPRVLDVAAGLGYFGLWVLGRHPHAHITAIEPDPLAAVMLRRTVRANACPAAWDVRDDLHSDSPADIDLLRVGPHKGIVDVLAERDLWERPRLVVVDAREVATRLAPQLREHGWTLDERDPLWAWRG